jgi:hypothetical protein
MTFFQGKTKKKSFAVDTAISWRESYSLLEQLESTEKYYHLKLTPKLLIKIDVKGNQNHSDEFSLWKEFQDSELIEFNVAGDLYFIDEDILKSKITKFFNSKKISYISIWGEWEELLDPQQDN